jgi:hypothetical protein
LAGATTLALATFNITTKSKLTVNITAFGIKILNVMQHKTGHSNTQH